MKTSDMVVIAIVVVVVIAILWILQKSRTDTIALLLAEDELFIDEADEVPVVPEPLLPHEVCVADVGTLSNGQFLTLPQVYGGPHHSAGEYNVISYTWDDSVPKPDGGYILTFSAMADGPGDIPGAGTSHVPGLKIIDEADYLSHALGTGTNCTMPYNTLSHRVTDNLCAPSSTDGNDTGDNPWNGYETSLTAVSTWAEATNVTVNHVGDMFEVSWDPVSGVDEYAVSVLVDGTVLAFKLSPDDGQTLALVMEYGQKVPGNATTANVEGITAGVAVSPGNNTNVPAFQTINSLTARVVGYVSCNVGTIRDGCYGTTIS